MKFLATLLLLLTFTFTHIEEAPPVPTFTQKDVRCLELNIHYEARGESVAGQKAVALVTINRTRSSLYPADVCKVVYQPKQFSWVAQHPQHDKTKVDPNITKIAVDALSNKYRDLTNGALFYHANYVKRFKREQVAVIGNHIFYR